MAGLSNISPTMMLIGFLVIIVVYGIYSVYALKDKIYCTFIREDRTTISKFVKVSAGKIDFDNRWYNLDISRTTQKFVWMGIIPTWTRCLIWKWDSNMPLNPMTWNNGYDNPSDRKALDRTENLRSLLINTKNSIGGAAGKPQKKGMMESLIPILLVCGLLVVGYFVYNVKNQQNMLGMQGNVMQSQMQEMQKSLDQLNSRIK